MPLTDLPVCVRILDNVVTTLQGINGSPTYYFSVAKVFDTGTIEAANDYPSIYVLPAETAEGVEGVNNATGTQGTTWALDIWGVIAKRDDTHRELLKLMHDIHKALLVNPSRGTFGGNANAIDTKWLSWSAFPNVDEQDLVAWVRMQVQVQFRTSNQDMTISR